MPNAEAKYFPNTVANDNFDCYDVYQDTSINMTQGEKYILIAETNGTFSSQHDPTVESDNCVLWLTDYSYTQIISDENTSQGTVFTWNGPTSTSYLRVNAYHKAANNTIYASNIRIYEKYRQETRDFSHEMNSESMLQYKQQLKAKVVKCICG